MERCGYPLTKDGCCDMNRCIVFSRILFPFLCLLPVFVGSSCAKKDKLRLNPEFSVNVAQPEKDFPNVENLIPSKKEVYELYGSPDFVRFWWSKDGRVHRFLEVDRQLRSRKTLFGLKHSWIYLDKNIECVFENNSLYREIPLNDKIRILCNYGDPEDIKILSDVEPYREIWNYYSQGVIFKFEKDKLVSQQMHTPMGHVIRK